MTDLCARTRQIAAFPVDRENIRVFAGGFGNRLFTQKAGSRNAEFGMAAQLPS